MPPTSRVSKPAKRATPGSSWTTKSPTRRSLEAERPRAAPVEEAAEGVDGEAKLGADEALAQARLGKAEAGVGREPAVVEQHRVEAIEAVAGSLRLAATVEGDDRPVPRTDLLLQLCLGLFDAARRGLGASGAEGILVVLPGPAHGDRGALGQGGGNVDV